MILKKFALMIAISALSLPAYLYADSAFEGKQGTVTRTGFSFFGGEARSLEVDSTGKIYAGFNSPSGVFCSTDGGTTWSSPAVGTDLGTISVLALGGTSGTAFVVGGVKAFRTTDTCQNWTEIKKASGFSDYSFAIVYATGTLLIGGRTGTVDRSTDDGATLTSVTVASGGGYVYALAASPTANEFFALVTVGSSNTLYKSTDAGVTWTSLNKSGDYVHLGVDPTNANHIILGGSSDGITRSTDGGATWNPVNVTGGFTNSTQARFVNNRVYLGTYWTTDFSTWHNTSTESTCDHAPLEFFVADPTDSTKIYSSTIVGIEKSTDGGSIFHDINSGLRAVQIYDIAQSADKNTVFIATGQGIAHTTNFLATDGPTWTFPYAEASFGTATQFFSILIDKNTPSTIYVGAVFGKIFRTTDAGATWTTVYTPGNSGLDAVSLTQTADGTLYASERLRGENSGSVIKSTDGLTWTTISTDTFDANVNVLGAIGNTVFAGLGNDNRTNTATQLGIWKYDGSTWTQIEEVKNEVVTDLATVGNTILVTTAARNDDQDGEVYRSSDAGQNWSDVTSSGLRTDSGWYRTVTVDPSDSNVVYVAHGRIASGSSEIYRSSDQGLSWSLIYTGLTDEVPSAMLVDDLLTGFQTGLYEFGEGKIKITPKIVKKSKQLQCTVKSGSRVLKSKQTIALVKAPKARVFKILKKANSNAKGVASFSLKKVKKKSKLYCTAVGQKSATKAY